METSSRTLRDSTRLVSAQLTVSLFSLGYFALITHLFSKLDIAALAVVGILNAIGGSVGGLGLMTLAQQRVPALRAGNSQDEAARLLGTCITYSVAGATLVALAIAAASRPLSLIFFKTGSASHLIVAAALLVISYKVYESVNLSMQALDDFRLVVRMRLLNDIGVRLVALPAYLLGGILGYLFTLACGQLTMAITVMILNREQMRLREFFNWRSAGHHIRESLPFYGHSVVRFGTAQADSLVVGIFLRPDLLATYYVIRRFYDYLALFFEALLAPLIPKVAERRQDLGGRVAQAFRKSSRYLLPICLLTVLMLLPLSPQLLTAFGGAKFMGGLTGLRLLFVAAALYGLLGLHSAFILAAGRPRDFLINEVTLSSINLGLSALLVPFYAVTGGAAARTLATAAAALISYGILSRAVSLRPSYDWSLLRRLLPVTVAAACAILLVQAWMSSALGVFLIWVAILIILFYWIMRSNPEDVDFIMESLRLQRWSFARRMMRLVRNNC